MPTLPPSIPSFLTSLVRNTAALPFPNATKLAHSVVIRSGHGYSVLFGNALLRGYLRCGLVSSALWLFDEMPARDVVSWNSMVSGFVGLGCWADSVGFFCSMRKAGFLPTLPSFVSVFVAVGELGWLPACRALHGELLKLGYSADCKAGNAAMSSYVKCSCVGDARGVLDGMCGVDDVFL